MKLLASDFDNTLYVEDYNTLKTNIESINMFRDRGNIFVVITGRSNDSILPLLKEYSVNYDYLICNSGSEIYDKANKLLKSIYIDQDDIDKIKSISLNNNLNMNTSYDNTTCINIKREENLTYEVIKTIQLSTNTYSYLSPNWLNIINADANKFLALKELESIINSDLEIYTIGDAINDIEMIEYYNGAMMKKHENTLDGLNCKEYETLSDYIKKIIND